LSGQYERPLRIVAFNITEGWARDLSTELAQEALAQAEQSGYEVPRSLREFVERTL
jgi:hypothetical protein